MKVFRDFRHPCHHSGHITTVGGFDGVHIGHQRILQEMAHLKGALGVPTLVVTFEVPPKFIIEERTPNLLTTVNEKLALLEASGVDEVVLLEFNEALRNTTASEFLERILLEELRSQWIVLGFNHRFGKGREGTPAFLAERVETLGFGLTLIPPLKYKGIPASSSNIRRLLKEGKVEDAAALLGRPYAVSGTVVEGRKAGKLLGFPTANLQVPPEKLLPADGVYAVRVRWQGRSFWGAANLGTAPTFGPDHPRQLEVHILNFNHQSLYGQEIEVEFLRFIRKEQRFESVEALRAQIERDLAAVRDLAKGASD